MNDPSALSSEPEVLLGRSTWLRRLAVRLMHDEHAADDVVQQTWLAYCKNHPRPRDPGAWLARTLRNFVAQWYRGESRRERREQQSGPPPPVPPADLTIERAELQRRVLSMVLALREPYKSTLLLRYFEELPVREVARRQGIAEGTVESRVHRALQVLRVRLDREFGERRHWALAFLASDLVRAWPRVTWLGPWSVGAAATVVIVSAFAVLFEAGGAEREARLPDPGSREHVVALANHAGGVNHAAAATSSPSAVDPEPDPRNPSTPGVSVPAEPTVAEPPAVEPTVRRPNRLRAPPPARPSEPKIDARLVQSIRDLYASWDREGTEGSDLFPKVERQALKVERSRRLEPGRLLADVPFWRTTLRRASVPERPKYRPGIEKLVVVAHEAARKADDGAAPPGNAPLTALLSVPKDHETRDYPVVVWLPPLEESSRSMLEASRIRDLFLQGHDAECLREAIWLVPVPPPAEVDLDPDWADEPRVQSIMAGLARFVLWNLRHDVCRVFLDGAAGNTQAVARIATRFPCVFAGAVVRDRVERTPGVDALLGASPARLLHSRWPGPPNGPALLGDEFVLEREWSRFLDQVARTPLPNPLSAPGDQEGFLTEGWLIATQRAPLEQEWQGIRVSASHSHPGGIDLITSASVGSAVILLNDEMLDLDQPIEVWRRVMPGDAAMPDHADLPPGTCVFAGRVRRDLRSLLRHHFSMSVGNFGEPFPASIHLDL